MAFPTPARVFLTSQPQIVVFSKNAGLAYRKRYRAEGAVTLLDKSCDFEQLPLAVANARASLAD